MTLCWLCDQPITDPPEIIGQFTVRQTRVVHRRCAQSLGELELNLQTRRDSER